MKINYFLGNSEDFYITEFGYSEPEGVRVVGPRVRDDYIFHLVLDGKCSYIGTDVCRSQAFFIAKGVLHDFKTEEGYRHMWIAFGGESAGEMLSALGINPSENSVFELSCFENVSSVWKSAFSYREDGKAVEEMAKAALLSAIACVKKRECVSSFSAERDYVSKAMDFMQKNLHRRVTMAEAARFCMISEKHLCRLFGEKLGVSPRDYLIKLKMERAARLLSEEALMVKEAAFSVGYDSQLEFSRMFKKYFGISPSEFKKDCYPRPLT